MNGIIYDVYYSSGNSGNRIFVFKNFPIIVVITSTAYNTPKGNKQVDKIMQNYLIETINCESTFNMDNIIKHQNR